MSIEETVDAMKEAMTIEDSKFAEEAKAIERNELAKEIFIRTVSSTGSYMFSYDDNKTIVENYATLEAFRTYARKCAAVWFDDESDNQ